MKKTLKKLQKTQKQTNLLLNKIKNAWLTYKSNIHKIWLSSIVIFALYGCGTTKLTATIHQPTDGSTSTITITTNTPITTDVKPDTNVEFKNDKSL